MQTVEASLSGRGCAFVLVTLGGLRLAKFSKSYIFRSLGCRRFFFTFFFLVFCFSPSELFLLVEERPRRAF